MHTSTFICIAATTIVAFATQSEGRVSDFCWRQAYGRGVGKIPGKCREGEERIGFFCYPKCEGYGKFHRFGFDCHQDCPDSSEWRGFGLHCVLKDYNRGVGRAATKCSGCTWGGCSGCVSNCKPDEDKNGLVCFPKCREGFEDYGFLGICRPPAPDCKALGMNNAFDISCARKVILGKPRVGACEEGQEKDTGLCYPKCKEGYKGAGPVCWRKAPKVDGTIWKECGMGASISTKECVSTVFSQVTAPLFSVLNIVTLGVTAGVSGTVKAASQPLKWIKLVNDAKKFHKIITSGKEFQKLAEVYDAEARAIESSNHYFAEVVDEESGGMHKNDGQFERDLAMVRIVTSLAGVVDPTGITDVVAAFTHPLCSDVEGADFDYE